MKKCPSCAEEVQDEAIKCRFCGSGQEPLGPIKYVVTRREGPDKGSWRLDEQLFQNWATSRKLLPMDEVHNLEAGWTEYVKNIKELKKDGSNSSSQKGRSSMRLVVCLSVLFLALVSATFLALMFGTEPKDKRASSETGASITSSNSKYVSEGTIACTTLEARKTITSIISSNDKQAFIAYLQADNGCIVLRDTLRVVTLDTDGFLEAYVKVVYNGTTFWVPFDSLKEKI